MTFETPFAMKGNALKHHERKNVAALMWGAIAAPRSRQLIQACALALALAACSGGDDLADNNGVDPLPAAVDCQGQCVNDSSFLSVADVQKVMSQAVAEAQARGVNATIAVTDRVGNVLGVYRMGDPATRKVTISTGFDANGNPLVFTGLEGITLPAAPPADKVNIDQLAVISKAGTAAYLSSEGNAFSTQSANQIVQENFNVGETDQPSGPLFGVQFSQLGCSDFSQRKNPDGTGNTQGTQRLPLGLSADPGGLPLYKGGVPVGAVGVIADGVYGIRKNISTEIKTGPDALDEAIAWAASFGFIAPPNRQGPVITIDGKSFRFSDIGTKDLMSNPATATAFASIPASVGTLIPVIGYNDGTIKQGTVFGTPASGIRPADAGMFSEGRDAFVFVDANNVNRFVPTAGKDAALLNGVAPLSAVEVTTLIDQALGVANQARAGIRANGNQQVRVTISIVDTQGNILGIARTRDAPAFGADVSLQKARSVGLMSSPTAGDYIRSLPDARYLTANATDVNLSRNIVLGSYVDAYRAFTNNANALTGETAFGDRSIGNIARPFFPDGFSTADSGPFSKPRGEWSVFSSGLQLDLAINGILQHVLFAVGVLPANADAARGCAGVALDPGFDLTKSGLQTPGVVRIGNGLQIFAGGVPLYRDNGSGAAFVGAIGISGDGIDQDDMVAFLGADRASRILTTGLRNAPPAMRADALTPANSPLASSPMRYVQCPQKPFLATNVQRVCEGK